MMTNGQRPKINNGGGAPRMPSVQCPGCGERAFARSTTGKATLLYREVYYHCRNVERCGCQFVVGMATLRATVPSRMPQPLAALPMTTWRHADNDRAANDDGGPPSEPAADAITI
jgi:hypothetical protein